MKKLIIFLLILVTVFSLKSQIIEDWTTPVALTDSSSFNSNPVVAVFPYDNPELYMFYEKGLINRQIWWKKISEPMSDEQMLIGGWPEVDYRNPQIILYNFLIIECNVFGNYDLFGVKFDENGLAGDIFRLTNTEFNENAFFGNTDYSNLCCWESGGNIYAAESQISQDTIEFTDLEIIDSGDCYDPVCQENYIAWRKIENNESHIYYSEKSWQTNQWTEPAPIIDTGNNINLSRSITIQEFGGGYNLCWQAENKIYFSELYGSYISTPEIPGVENYYEPTAYNMVWLVDFFSNIYSFAGETESVRDIYIADEYVSGYVLNITDDSNINKNPRLFNGRGDYSYHEIINIWQTEVNGFDVLFSSFAMYNVVIGKIDENKTFQLSISPNPVGTDQNIIIDSPENISVKSVNIYSVSGNLIKQKEFSPQNNGYEFSLNEQLPGLYFIRIQTSHGVIVRKLIKI